MSEPKSGATKGRRPATGKAKEAATRSKTTAKTGTTLKAAANRKASETAKRRAERERLRALLPPLDPHYQTTWDRGSAKAYASRNADPVRIALRSVHKKQLAAIEQRTGLDRQIILNRAVASAWEKLGMSGSSLENEATRIRKQASPAAGTVSLYPTAETLRIFRQADHPQAKAILLQTGLNLWK